MSGQATPSRSAIVGYVDPLVVHPGAQVQAMVSTSEPSFEARLLRLRHGDADPAGPGVREEEVAALGRGTGGVQDGGAGSFVWIPAPRELPAWDAFTLQAWIWPTLRDPAATQCVLQVAFAGGGGLGLCIEPSGVAALRLTAAAGEPAAVLALSEPLPLRRWQRLTASWDGRTAAATIALAAEERWPGLPTATAAAPLGAPLAQDARVAHVLIAAAAMTPRPDGTVGIPRDPFTGKVEAPRLAAAARPAAEPLADDDPAVVGRWDFAADPADLAGSRVTDRGPHGLHGTCVNGPARAVTGRAWRDGRRLSEGHEGFEAIHFHDDDLDDLGWRPSLAFTVPADARSGYYAVRVEAGGEVDRIPLIVSAAEAPSSAEVCLLAPTLTYLAYADNRFDAEAEAARGFFGRPLTREPLIERLALHPEWGLSLYDRHRDGSGVMYASSRRPLMDLRAGYRNPFTNAPRHLGADLYLVDWLEQLGYRYDVVTDHDLDRHGPALLERYRVVLTGTHPEYTTARMRTGLEGYLAGGGRLMYLGGNGFYWVTSRAPDREHVIEVRRGNGGTRPWDSEPGEACHSTTGELGGLWRHRGAGPHALAGVGFAGQGFDDRTPGYERLDGPDVPAFVFDGVDVRTFGEAGLAMGGAAGDELDRCDPERGSPQETVVLARSTGHGPHYWPELDEVLSLGPGLSADRNDRVRSELAYLRGPGGGAVFSVGSICWCGSLSQEDYDGATSRITRNVLDAFLAHDDGDDGTVRR